MDHESADDRSEPQIPGLPLRLPSPMYIAVSVSRLEHDGPSAPNHCRSGTLPVEARVRLGGLEVPSSAEGNREGGVDRGLIGQVCGAGIPIVVDYDGVHTCRIVR